MKRQDIENHPAAALPKTPANHMFLWKLANPFRQHSSALEPRRNRLGRQSCRPSAAFAIGVVLLTFAGPVFGMLSLQFAAAQVPGIINYQDRVVVSGTAAGEPAAAPPISGQVNNSLGGGMDSGTSGVGGHFGTDGFGSYDPMTTPLSVLTNYFAWEAGQIAAASLTWNRTLSPMGGPFCWARIEPNPGTYIWTNTDALVKACQGQGIRLLALVHPYTPWDQPEKTDRNYGKPQDTNSFKAFLQAMVERYDGDGTNDMPGLDPAFGVRYWEISNEPENGFFGGNMNRPQQYQDYRDTLQMAYAAIKSADHGAAVLNAGTSPIFNPVTTNFETGVMDFWDNVITNQGGSNYIDILNIHYTIPEPSKPLQDVLNQWSKFNKKMWVSESGTYAGALNKDGRSYPFRSETNQAAWWVKHCCYGLAHNVEKLFWASFYQGAYTPDWFQYSAMIDSNQAPKLIHSAQCLLAAKIDNFASLVEVAYTSSAGRYKFMAPNLVYVLWDDFNGVADVSGDFTGTVVRVTDALGNVSIQAAASVQLGAVPVYVEATGSGRQPAVGDYDGDGKADPALYDLASGFLVAWLSSVNYTPVAPAATFQVQADETPAMGDYDGDGKADPAVFDAKLGHWYIWLSSASYARVGPVAFGVSANDIAAPADFDGDGQTDPAVYGAATGGWTVWLSSLGYLKAGPYVFQQSAALDVPVPGRYDGAVSASPAMYEAGNGAWYIWLAGSGYGKAGPFTFSTTEDHIAAPADYDGDGLCDPAAYVPSTGLWRIWLSGSDYRLVEALLQ